jgi:hypothetical protein
MNPRIKADSIMSRAIARFREAAWPDPGYMEPAERAGDGNPPVAPREDFARDYSIGKRAVHLVGPPGTPPPATPSRRVTTVRPIEIKLSF